MNIVMITTGKRPQLFHQTLQSLFENAADWRSHHVTLVCDGHAQLGGLTPNSLVINLDTHGASYSRNVGAGSIPRYRRQNLVMFADDDCFFLKDWDRAVQEMADRLDRTIMSPYGHPFNIEEPREAINFAKFPLLISSVAMVMRWTAFDEIGPWMEPGGPGGSEDFEFCARARDLGYDFAVSNPHAVIHCGLTSSNGTAIVGADLLKERNAELERRYGVEGKVIYG